MCDDFILLSDGNSVTLPLTPCEIDGKVVDTIIVKKKPGPLSVTVKSDAKIDGNDSITLYTDYDSATFKFKEGQWWIV